MEFINLPLELHLLFADHLDSADLSALIRTGRRVEYLLRPEIDRRALGHRTPSGDSVLHWAAGKGMIRLAQRLISQGLQVSTENLTNRTPLFPATDADDPDMMRLLIAQGADVSHRDCAGKNPLFLAARNGSITAVEILLLVGADASPIIEPYSRVCPLLAAMHPRREHDEMEQIVRLLLNAGADPTAGEHYHLCALDETNGRTDIALAILMTGATFSIETLQRTVDRAIEAQCELLVEILLFRGVDALYAMERAVFLGNVSMLCFLSELKVGLLPSQENLDRYLMVAVGMRGLEMTRVLLSLGANPSAPVNFWQETVLHHTVKTEDTELARLLIGWGSNTEARSAQNKTPLFCAVQGAKANVTRLLLDAGADPMKTDNMGRSVLHHAAEFEEIPVHRGLNFDVILGLGVGLDDRRLLDMVSIVDDLLKAGVDINAPDDQHRTPLSLAADHDTPRGIGGYLIRRGAQLMAQEGKSCDGP